jgi:geranylgeranyl pyrophosphate synthase
MALDDLDRLLAYPGVARRVGNVLHAIEVLLRDGASPAARPAIRMAGAAGKGLRPALTITTAALGRCVWDRVLNAAMAVELVQVGSLVHDDIFEQAIVRRGTATINAVEGGDIALMVGDYILARAGQAAARAGDDVALAVGRAIEELCIGQFMETQELFDLDRAIDSHFASINGKTAALFACSCRVGGLCAGLADESLDAITRFGEAFGMCFQVIDDVLDLISSAELLGKPANIDIATGVYTLPVLLALRTPRSAALRGALEARLADRARDEVLRAGTVTQALDRARAFAAEASAALEFAPSLRAFPQRYMDWALRRFVP